MSVEDSIEETFKVYEKAMAKILRQIKEDKLEGNQKKEYIILLEREDKKNDKT